MNAQKNDDGTYDLTDLTVDELDIIAGLVNWNDEAIEEKLRESRAITHSQFTDDEAFTTAIDFRDTMFAMSDPNESIEDLTPLRFIAVESYDNRVHPKSDVLSYYGRPILGLFETRSELCEYTDNCDTEVDTRSVRGQKARDIAAGLESASRDENGWYRTE